MYLYFIILLILYLTFKYNTKKSFWINQPVFHKYNFFNWLYSPRIVNNKLPDKDKWYDCNNIKTFEFTQLNDIEKQDMSFFILCNYKNEGNIKYLPSYNEIIPYFLNHNKKSYISIFYQDLFLSKIKTDKIIKTKEIAGIITSRPLNLKINNLETYIAYTDFLCLDKKNRNKQITPKMIFTHYYDFNKDGFEYPIAFFKREVSLNKNIIPFVTSKVYGFNITTLRYEITTNYSIIKINKVNINLLLIILKLKFKCIIMADFSNLIELINSNNVIVYVLLNAQINGQEPLSIYFYRETKTVYINNNKTIELFASVNLTDDYIFYDGFLKSIEDIKQNNNILLIEDMSHNNIIINNLFINNQEILKNDIAYYFYNFIHNPINCNDALIIC